MLIQCPNGHPCRWNERVCPACGFEFTLGSIFRHYRQQSEATVEPTRQRIHQFSKTANPQTKRLIRWSYFLGSAVALWQMLAYVEARVGEGWIGHAALSIVYLAVFLTGVRLFVGRKRLRALVDERSVSVKLGLIMNFFCLLILLQIFIGEWWVRSLVMAGLFLALWLALYVLHTWLLPMLQATQETFLGSEAESFDHTRPQGRSTRRD